MKTMWWTLAIVLGLCVTDAAGQAAATNPHIGYVYPAGGERGRTFRVTIGGQSLRGASDAYITGAGVHAKVIQDFPPIFAIDPDERAALAEQIRAVFTKRWTELVKSGRVRDLPASEALARGGLVRDRKRRAATQPAESGAKPPAHPLLYDLDKMSLRELVHAVSTFRSLRTGQRNQQLATTVLVEISIDRDATPGERELRLSTRLGLTNPLRFHVGTLPETRELETGDVRIVELLPQEPALTLPIVINGQILPGDVDRFRFSAKRGQRLVFETHARQLMPYLADAVPGWFQATLTLYDESGEELAFVDDYRFNPDPVFCYDVPEDGVYTLEIRDSIYRGREDFVYRVTVGQRPYVTSIFPLGCRVGQQRYVVAAGWNLYSERFFIDGKTYGGGIWQRPLGRGPGTANVVTYEVNALHAQAEVENNDTLAAAPKVRLPLIIDGRIEQPGDVDMYRFAGHAGDEIVIEAIARRVRSPLDSLVRLLDASGNVVAWNDDYEHKDGFLHTGMGELTHHADAYLRTQLPAAGDYYVQICDTQAHGSPAHAYRLRVGPPQPDFALRVTPSSINARAGFSMPLNVYALRKDGFAGPIDLVLKDAPPGFSLSGARIPAGSDSARFTLNAPIRRIDVPFALTIEGYASIDGQAITRPAIPAEDMMQAFLYQHLVPSQELVVSVVGGRRMGMPIRLVDKPPVRIRPGATTMVRLAAPRHPKVREIVLELSDPLPGITLGNVTHTPGGLTIELVAEPNVNVGSTGNLVVSASLDINAPDKKSGQASKKRRITLGAIPAIPFEVVP